MKITKVITLNVVELNQVMVDFAALINHLETISENSKDLKVVDIKDAISILKFKPSNGGLSTYNIMSNVTSSVRVDVEY